MTKLIIALIIIVVLWGGWHLFLYWDKVNHEEEVGRKQAASSMLTDGSNLQGLPEKLEPGFRLAEKQGPKGMRAWLKANGRSLKDPRKAWIELDYAMSVFREDPADARRVYNEVRDRTPPNSPVWPRIRQMEQTYK